MLVSLTPDDVRHAAALAHIALEPDGLEALTRDLTGILEHIGRIASLDLTDVPPTSHALDLVNVLGDDVPRPSAARGAALAGARAHRRRLPRAPDRRLMAGLDVERTSAEEIARLLDARELSCEDVATAYLDRMAEPTTALNVFLHIDPERTLARARALDGDGRSGIAGVPIAYKDLLCIRGVPTTAGSRVLEGYRPPYTATVVAAARPRARELGKTNMDEFAMGSSTENSAFGPTRNPWDRERVPGRLERRLGGRRRGRRWRRSRSAPTRAARSASRPRSAASSA